MHAASFEIRADGDGSQVASIDRLSNLQRAYLKAHKRALVGLLSGAEILHCALMAAGGAGLDWRKGQHND